MIGDLAIVGALAAIALAVIAIHRDRTGKW
jgi:hypothetical protein